jgi:hypothetical protein
MLPLLLLLPLLSPPAVQVRRVICSYRPHPRVWQQRCCEQIIIISISSSRRINQQGACTNWLAWQAEQAAQAAAGQCCL